MKNKSHHRNDLQQLLGKLAEGELLDEEFRELGEILASDRAARDEYRRYLEVVAMLHFEHSVCISDGDKKSSEDAAKNNKVCVPNAVTTAQSGGQIRRFAPSSFIGASSDQDRANWKWLACLLMLGALVGTAGTEAWHRNHKNNDQATIRGEIGQAYTTPAPVAPVAFLTSTNGCNWSGVTPLLHTVGSSVQMGDELALHEGVAEFRMANGVYLGLEGPASLLLVSPSKLVLQYGKLTTHVPWGTTDFQVVAGACRVSTRDGEFGLSRLGSKLGIHVFSGEASVASSVAPPKGDENGAEDDPTTADGKDYFAEATVTTGRALSLTSHGELITVDGWGKAKSDLFVAKLSMSGPLPITQEYVERVLSSNPIEYWRFEQVVNSKIHNEIKSGTDLIVKDQSLLVGGDGNLSAELRSDGDWYLKSKSKVPLAESEYSIEVWVKPSHLHLGNIVSLDCGDDHHSTTRIELKGGDGDSNSDGHSGLVRYVHRTYKGKEHDFGTSCYTSRPYSVRRWQHVVAVKTASEMKLYIDGKLSTSAKEGSKLPGDVKVVVGFLNGGDNRRFVGQIDELAIYNRALAEREIVQHYRTVKRATETSPVNKGREQPGAKSVGA